MKIQDFRDVVPWGRSFEIEAIAEMLRVAAEVRIFPLLDLAGRPSAHLEPVANELHGGCEPRVVEVPYEFQRGGNSMLVIRRRAGADALEPEALST